MMPSRRSLLALLAALPIAGRGHAQEAEVPFVPTPTEMVEAMLDLARVGPEDHVIDLGSGDGRITIAAARRGARAVGIEIDPDLVARARFRAREAGVEALAQFRRQDLFETPLREADVVMLYLLPDVNLRLRPRLLTELAPGARIVSHAFGMGEWRPDAERELDGRRAFLWIVPAVAGGTWRMTTADGGERRLTIAQRFQRVDGTLDGQPIRDALLDGRWLRFTATIGGAERKFEAQVGDRALDGIGWRAERID